MESAQDRGKPQWTASSWRSLVYEDIVHAPDTYGVVIFGDLERGPILVTHGVIREEVWRLFRDPRSKAHDLHFYRYIETLIDREAERLARTVLQQLEKNTGRGLAWRDLPDRSGASAVSSR